MIVINPIENDRLYEIYKYELLATPMGGRSEAEINKGESAYDKNCPVTLYLRGRISVVQRWQDMDAARFILMAKVNNEEHLGLDKNK